MNLIDRVEAFESFEGFLGFLARVLDDQGDPAVATGLVGLPIDAQRKLEGLEQIGRAHV